MRADKVFANHKPTKDRIDKDLGQIKRYLAENDQSGDKDQGKQQSLFMIGTHCDLDPQFKNITPETEGTYHDEFMKKLTSHKLFFLLTTKYNQGKGTPVILGSMKTRSEMEKIAYKLLLQVSQ